MKKGNEISLKEAIDKLLDVYKLRGKLVEVNIKEHWEKVAGKLISNRTVSLEIRNKKLFVKFDNPLLKQEMHYVKDKLTTRLNQEVGNRIIDEIVFV
jgi:hypothetical protein